MFTNEKAEQTFLQHLIVPVWQLVKSFKVVLSQVLYVEKHMHMQISVKLVAEACDDFKILTHTSKGEQINFKFLFIQFTCWLVR